MVTHPRDYYLASSIAAFSLGPEAQRKPTSQSSVTKRNAKELFALCAAF